MMMQTPDGIRSVPGPGGRFGLRWSPLEGKDIQKWHLVRSDYPVGPIQAPALFSGALDLMVTRWELHPTWTAVVEDTGAQGKHYTVLGMDTEGQVWFPADFGLDPTLSGTSLKGEKAQPGWVKAAGAKKDKYSGMF